MAFLYSFLRRLFPGEEKPETPTAPATPGAPQPQVIVLRPERLVETYTAPRSELLSLWGLLSGDCALSLLTETEIAKIQLYINLINMIDLGIRSVSPLRAKKYLDLKVDMMNAAQRDILAICRTARSRQAITLRSIAPVR